MSDNWKYLVTDNVFLLFNVKCLTTASVSKQKVSHNSKCLDSCKCLTTANISQLTMSFSFMPENVWQQPTSLQTMSELTLSCTWKCLATEYVILVHNGLWHTTEDGSQRKVSARRFVDVQWGTKMWQELDMARVSWWTR